MRRAPWEAGHGSSLQAQALSCPACLIAAGPQVSSSEAWAPEAGHGSSLHAEALFCPACLPQLGLKFPKAGAPEAVIDTGAHEERALTGAERDTYALVIRMETVTDKGRAEAHTLQVRRQPVPAPRQPCRRSTMPPCLTAPIKGWPILAMLIAHRPHAAGGPDCMSR